MKRQFVIAHRIRWRVASRLRLRISRVARSAEPAGASRSSLRALTLEIGDTRRLTATVRDGEGTIVDDARVVFYSRARRSVSVSRSGLVEAYRPGEATLVALVPVDP